MRKKPPYKTKELDENTVEVTFLHGYYMSDENPKTWTYTNRGGYVYEVETGNQLCRRMATMGHTLSSHTPLIDLIRKELKKWKQDYLDCGC